MRLASVLHSLDSVDLAEVLERACADEGRSLEVFVQLKLWPEETKSGLDPAELPALRVVLERCPHLAFAGLMTMGPLLADENERARAARTVFAKLARRARALGPGCRTSMGMARTSGAVEEGADLVRVGSALFAGLPAEESDA